MPCDDVDEEIQNWKAMMDGGPSIRVQVIRVHPSEWAGRKISGTIDTYDELPDVETLRADHGGGHFRCIVKRPDATGRFIYARGGHVVVKIAGDPIVPINAPLATSKPQRDMLRREIENAVTALIEDRLRAVEVELRRMRL